MKIEELKCVCDNIKLTDYINYFNLIKNNMQHPDWLGDFGKEQIENILNAGGKIWIFRKGNEIVCSMFFIPISNSLMKKLEIEYNNKTWGECGPIMVSKKFIGNGLQKQMLEILDKYCIERDIHHIVTTIHPDNIYSINNFEKSGYKYINTLILERGTRKVYIKKLFN